MPRQKTGVVGFGLSARANLNKNQAIQTHKRQVMKNQHNHKIIQNGLKRQFHTKNESIGNYAGPDVLGWS